uniref:Glycosyl transferase family 1 domain-containing protein n=1 Tax=viral metagenome TaxID=1070528 RepID=A0A6C0DRE3_9ZZZZ
MLKIGIVGSLPYHIECIGFIIELFHKNDYIIDKEIEINIFIINDMFKYIDYFLSLYPDSKINIYNLYERNIPNVYENNYIIKLTSNDPIVENENIISILHAFHVKDISKKYITLSPLVTNQSVIPFSLENENAEITSDLNYIFPLYAGLISRCNTNTITYIGWFQEDYLDDDLKKFILHSKYTFNFIVNNYDMACCKDYSNVNIFLNTDTPKMIDIILNSKFILARKLKYSCTDRFSGALSLAISHKKPLIMNKYFSDIYDIPSIHFNEDYCEALDQITSMSDYDYNDLLNKIEIFYDKQNDYNKCKISNMI